MMRSSPSTTIRLEARGPRRAPDKQIAGPDVCRTGAQVLAQAAAKPPPRGACRRAPCPIFGTADGAEDHRIRGLPPSRTVPRRWTATTMGVVAGGSAHQALLGSANRAHLVRVHPADDLFHLGPSTSGGRMAVARKGAGSLVGRQLMRCLFFTLPSVHVPGSCPGHPPPQPAAELQMRGCPGTRFTTRAGQRPDPGVAGAMTEGIRPRGIARLRGPHLARA